MKKAAILTFIFLFCQSLYSLEFTADYVSYPGERMGDFQRICLSGDVAKIRQAISQGVNINRKDFYGCVPLIYAVISSNEQAVKLLLTKNARIYIANSDGWTAIHYAVKLRLKSILKLLIDSDGDVNAANIYRLTPLHYAVACGDIDIAKLLIDKGAIADVQDINGCQPIHLAYRNKDFKMMHLLYKTSPAIRLDRFPIATPVHFYSALGDAQSVAAYLEVGVDVQTADFEGYSGFHIAAYAGERKVLNTFIDFGWKPETILPVSPVICAMRGGQFETAKVLISMGLDKNATDERNRTACIMLRRLRNRTGSRNC